MLLLPAELRASCNAVTNSFLSQVAVLAVDPHRRSIGIMRDRLKGRGEKRLGEALTSPFSLPDRLVTQII